MTLKDAKVLRDEIKRVSGFHCIVPLGHGPDSYFARIFSFEKIDFYDRASFRRYRAQQIRTKRALELEWAKRERRRARSPLDIMIDRACGVEPRS